MKYYKTVFQIEVLSEYSAVGDLDLEQLHRATYDGDCSGKMDVVEVKELTSKEAAQGLIEHGSDPEFFMLTEDGEEIDE